MSVPPFFTGGMWDGIADFSYIDEQILYYYYILCVKVLHIFSLVYTEVTYFFTCIYTEVFLNIYFKGKITFACVYYCLRLSVLSI